MYQERTLHRGIQPHPLSRATSAGSSFQRVGRECHETSTSQRFLCLAAGAAALPILSHIAGAQAWPTRPVRLIVPFAAGGATDIFARLIGQWLSNHLGQQFVIEIRPGAATNIGSEATADGYTLCSLPPLQ